MCRSEKCPKTCTTNWSDEPSSLQQYLSAQLASMVATPTIDDMIARIERRSKGRLSRADAIKAIDNERARR